MSTKELTLPGIFNAERLKVAIEEGKPVILNIGILKLSAKEKKEITKKRGLTTLGELIRVVSQYRKINLPENIDKYLAFEHLL